MSAKWFGLGAVVALLVGAGGAGVARAAEASGAATPATLVVMLHSLTGAPADSASRIVFMNAFTQEFDADQLSWQLHTGDVWKHLEERRNPFRLVDLASPDQAWMLDVTIGLPPTVVIAQNKQKSSDPTPRPRTTDFRASRGLTIVAAATAPSPGYEPTPGERVKFAVFFPDARRVVVPSYKLPGGAYAYPWEEAGRCVARAALEVLHRAKDSVDPDERADLSPAVRTEDTP